MQKNIISHPTSMIEYRAFLTILVFEGIVHV